MIQGMQEGTRVAAALLACAALSACQARFATLTTICKELPDGGAGDASGTKPR